MQTLTQPTSAPSGRNLNYDLLRLLGLLIIVVAHSNPPEWLFQLRNFGTPLLVLGSGLTYALIYRQRSIAIKAFYHKRIKHLVVPVWLFLSLFFTAYYAINLLTETEFPFSIRKIVSSYALLGGIGFVWVFKIYLLLALITPLALYLNNNIKDNRLFYFGLTLCYIGYETLVSLFSATAGNLVNSVIFTVIPYALIYLYAFRLNQLNDKQIMLIAALSLILFLLSAGFKYLEQGHFVATQGFKYPPTFYYLSYAFFAINTCYLLIKRLNIQQPFAQQSIKWLSGNSLWLYLWHIAALFIWSALMGTPDGSMLAFLQKALFVLAFAAAGVILQNKVRELCAINTRPTLTQLKSLFIQRHQYQ